MALTNCSECEGRVSETAGACPHCGHREHAGSYEDIAIIVVVTMIGLVIPLFLPASYFRGKQYRKDVGNNRKPPSLLVEIAYQVTRMYLLLVIAAFFVYIGYTYMKFGYIPL